MILNRSKLLEALKRCLPGIDQVALLLEGADTFVFHDGKIFSYNDNISVVSPFETPEPLEGAVKAKEFYELISRFTGEEITLTPSENSWVLQSGRAKASLALLEAKTIARINGILIKDTFLPLPGQFQEAIKVCQFSGNKSSLSGIFVVDSFMFATDEHRINLFEFSDEFQTFWISEPAAKELANLPGLKEYAVMPSWIQFRSENGTVFACKRLMDAKFPYDKLKTIVKENDFADGDFTAVLPKMLQESMGRATALAMDMEKLKAVQLSFSTEGIRVFSERATGVFQEQVPWETVPEGEIKPVTIFVDQSMVDYGLKRSRKFYIKEDATSKRIVFRTDTSIHIIGTISAPEEESTEEDSE